MRVIRPQTIDDANLTSSTIAEPDAGETVWVPATLTLGTRRINTTTHRVYEVVADPDTADDPVGVNEGINANPPTWVNVAPTNKFAMFDNINSTQSSETTSLVVEITTGLVTNSIAGFNIDGASTINVTMTDPTAGVVFDRDISMINNSQVGSWWDFFFAPIINITSFVILDMPIFPDATIKITVTGSTIDFGSLIVGSQITLGITNFGTSLQLLDFSRKETDSFGNTVVVPGRTSKLVNFNVTIQKSLVGYVFDQLTQLTGSPSVWVGTDETDDATLVFGYYRNFRNNISSPTITDATITVEGLV
jgi:hypothetical protein